MRLIMVRHGESECNAAGMVSSDDTPLSQKEREQGEKNCKIS